MRVNPQVSPDPSNPPANEPRDKPVRGSPANVPVHHPVSTHSPPEVVPRNNPDVTTHNPPPVIQPSCSSPSTSQALVFEEIPMLANILQNNGWKVVRYSPHQINSGNTSHLAYEIKQGHFNLLWIDMPHVGRHVPKAKMHSALSQLCRWLQLASEVGVTACTFGAFGHSWNHENFAVLTQQHHFHKSYHRACHFGLKMDINQTEPSKICFVLLSTPKVESHLCKCEVPQTAHKLDWKSDQTSIARRPRMRIQHHIAQAVVQRLLETVGKQVNHRVHHDTPDCQQPAHTDADMHLEPNSCFPTEERMRQKERLKKMKEAGVKPKTRQVHVEDHHDDCGSDHSALAPFMHLEVTEQQQQQQHEMILHQALDALDNFEYVHLSSHCYHADNVQTALNMLAPLESKVDIVEICGGSARTSQICIRKHLKVGRNFDLVTNVDLKGIDIQADN